MALMTHRRARSGKEPSGRPFYRSEREKIETEAGNGLLLFDEVSKLADSSRPDLRLSPELIRSFHHLAINDVSS